MLWIRNEHKWAEAQKVLKTLGLSVYDLYVIETARMLAEDIQLGNLSFDADPVDVADEWNPENEWYRDLITDAFNLIGEPIGGDHE